MQMDQSPTKSSEHVLKKLKPDIILHHLSHCEENLWRQFYLGDSLDLSQSEASIGIILIRHGQVVKKIHEYFSNLEPQKCCLLLAAGKTSFNNVRLVKHDATDSDIEEGAMFKSPFDNIPTVQQLDSKDFAIFHHSYMCAAFPVLGAPEPPSAFTPSPVSSPDSGQPKFLYTGILSISRPRTPQSLHDSGVEVQDDTSIIPAETLAELLRRSHCLTTDKFRLYEQAIFTSCGKKTHQKILAEELVTQLAALENNSNPFYNPHNFLLRQGYDYWQQRERTHITELLNKFWHFSLPSTNASKADHLKTIHGEYQILMEKLIRYEYPFRNENEPCAPAPTSPLSSASVRLLKEFGLRYGIGEFYRKVVYLHYLSVHFDPTVWFIQHATSALISVMELLPNNRSHLVIVRDEFDILDVSVKTLLARVSAIIPNIKNMFLEIRPVEGLDSLIELISKTLQVKEYLTMQKQMPLDQYLYDLVQNIFPTAYEKHKMVAIVDLRQNSWITELSPKLLNVMIGKIRDEVNDYKNNYQVTFKRFFNITSVAAQAFYSLLMDDVMKLCRMTKDEVVDMEINLLMVSLAYRLNQLDKHWMLYILPQEQKWRTSFLQEGLYWSIVLKVHMQDMVIEAVTHDKFVTQEIHVDSLVSSTSSTIASHRGRSVSTKSWTPSTFSAFSSILSSTHSTPIFKPSVDGTSQVLHPCPVIQESACEYSNSNHSKRAMTSATQTNFQMSTDNKHRCASLSGLNKFNLGIPLFAHVHSCSSLPDMICKSYETQRSDFLNEQYEQKLHSGHCEPWVLNSDVKSNDNCRNLQMKPEIIAQGKIQNGVANQEDCDANSEKSSTFTYSSENRTSEISDPDDDHFPGFPKLKEVVVVPQIGLDIESVELHPNSNDDSNTKISSNKSSHSTQSLHINDAQDYNSNYSPNRYVDAPRISVIPYHARSDQPTFYESTKSESPVSSSICDKLGVKLSSPQQQNSSANIPVSSSVVDIVAILQRLINLGGTLCQTLCPVVPMKMESDFTGSQSIGEIQYQFQSEMTSARQELYESFLNALCSTLCLYADNLICLDLCGTTFGIAKRLAGPKLVEYLQTQWKSGIICGCRHAKKGSKDCLSYLRKQADFLCDRHEPVTRDMCTRINNVASIIQYLETYHRLLAQSFDIASDRRVWQNMELPENGNSHLGESVNGYVVVDGYEYDPSVDHSVVMETISQQAPFLTSQPQQSSSLVVQSSVEPCRQHLLAIIRAQSRLMAYRINLFIHDAIVMLLSLRTRGAAIETVLQPVTDFLENYIRALTKWLYRDCLRRILECIWIFIVQDFESELDKLQSSADTTEHKAKLLIQAFSHFFRLMNDHDRGIKKHLLLSQAEDITFKLQLHTLPTSQLISLYKGLEHFYRKSDTAVNYLNEFSQTLLHKMRLELQRFRKCFSGARLMQWILNNYQLFDTYVPENVSCEAVGTMSRERALAIGQKLMDDGLIQDIEELHFSQVRHTSISTLSSLDGDTAYPELSIHHYLGSSIVAPRSFTSESNDTPTASPQNTTKCDILLKHDENRMKKKDAFFSDYPNNDEYKQSKQFNSNAIYSAPDQSKIEKSNESEPSGNVILPSEGVHILRDQHPNLTITVNNTHKTDVSNGMMTPSSILLESTTCSSYSQFSPSRREFYHVTSSIFCSLGKRSASDRYQNKEELYDLVEQCFEKKITSEYIAAILYGRRRYDHQARDYIRKLPESIRDEMKYRMDDPATTCVSS